VQTVVGPNSTGIFSEDAVTFRYAGGVKCKRQLARINYRLKTLLSTFICLFVYCRYDSKSKKENDDNTNNYRSNELKTCQDLTKHCNNWFIARRQCIVYTPRNASNTKHSV